MLDRLKVLTWPWLWIVVAGLTVLRLIASAMMPLMPDEAYYWLWAQHPAAFRPAGVWWAAWRWRR